MAAAAAAAATAFASSANGWPVAVADSQWNGRRDGRMPNAKGVKKREAKTSPACPPAMDGNEYQIPIDLSEGVREVAGGGESVSLTPQSAIRTEGRGRDGRMHLDSFPPPHEVTIAVQW